MKIAIIILAVALALFIYLFILSEISLRQEINEWAKEVVENEKLKEAITELEKKVELYPQIIANEPTADGEPVRHGWWEFCCNFMGEYLFFKCSECEQKADVPTCMGKPIFEYCPFCGAKMDGGERVEEQQAETDNNSETG